MTFRLKEIRLECGIKRSKLANDLNINAGTIANYENEIRQAPYEYLIEFANYFDVTIDYLLGKSQGEIPVAKNETVLSFEERQLVNDFRKLSDLAKKRVTEYIDLWKDKE